MSDIVERTRKIADAFGDLHGPCETAVRIVEAADEIERLHAEIERLRAGGCARNQRLTQYCAEVQAAVLAEREACARVADPMPESSYSTPYEKQAIDIRTNVAAAIRARTVAEKPLTEVDQIT